MATVLPFFVVRPRDDSAGAIIAPPYDVLSDAEARALAINRHCFVRVTRAEVDLPVGADSHSDHAYNMARQNLDAFLADRLLVQEETPSYLIYGQQMGEHRQLGILGAASVAEYNDGTIAKHEFTRPDKEDDRTHHMEVLDAQVGLVFLAYRDTPTLSQLLTQISSRDPRWRVTTEDGVIHTVWSVLPAEVAQIQSAFAEVPRLYIADGHHRSAAASRVHANRQDVLSSSFLVGLYPSNQLKVMAYNRVVHDLNGLCAADFLTALRSRWVVTPDVGDTPSSRGDTRMYMDGAWWKLELKPAHRVHDDPVRRLDVAQLQEHLLQPILGISDPRRSTRIDFVGGIHGPSALQQRVDDGRAVAFHLFPTSMDELFDVADAGEVMPPKSTWFEPKLREGVAVRLLR